MAENNKQKRINLESNLVERLDAFLTSNIEGMSRRWAKKACSEGLVRVNHKRQKAGYILKVGDKVEVTLSLPAKGARAEVAANDQEFLDSISIVYEDESIIVLDKPREVHSVTLGEQDEPTIADFLANHDGSLLEVSDDPREAGLVQRLDYFTSGLIVAAKTKPIWQKLHKYFSEEEVEKKYVAVVEGEFTKKEIFVDKKIKGAGDHVIISDSKDAIRSKTNFEFLKSIDLSSGDKASVLIATASGARRHQIRVHAASIDFPLVGDELYGSSKSISELGLEGLDKGFYLHASEINLVHPVTKKQVTFKSEHIWM